MTPVRLAEPLPNETPALPSSPLVPILIIDDNAPKRLALKAILSPLGYSIVQADSGLAALRLLMDQEFAAILLDVRMPIMDGFETAALIRQREQSEMTPIIFITAHGTNDMLNTDLYAQGAVDFMFAPVQPHELRAKISVFANLFLRAKELAARAQEVQTSADQLKLLTDAAPIGIFQTDARNRYIQTNPRWSEITGIPAEEAFGRDWNDIIGSEGRVDSIVELPFDDVEGGASEAHPAMRSERFEIQQPGASSRIVMATSKSIPSSAGTIAGWVGTLADVTAETGAEAAMAAARDEANEASRMKSNFLANMSHEIRTPMNGVIGMTDLLLQTKLDDRQLEYLQTVRTSGNALLTILNDILDFSKVEAGKLEIENVEFDVRVLADDVVSLLAGAAETKDLALVVTVDDAVPASVRSDPGRVRQVLINLIGNAVKFTRAGRVVLTITQPDESFLRFEISDTGDGIEPEKLALIFQPFVQADMSTSRKYGGTGLGLAISSELVALLGGDCGVSSLRGIGSNFWFTISIADTGTMDSEARTAGPSLVNWPVSLAAASNGSISSNGSAVKRPPRARREDFGCVLLAEDNPVNQGVATALLEHLGFEVDTVANGAEAVDAIASGDYRAILMDCQMPVMDGYDATERIRQFEGPASTHTPIVGVTASAMKTDKQRCLAAGMDDYLPKPLSLETLALVMDRWAPNDAEHAADPDVEEHFPPAQLPGSDATASASPALDSAVVGQLELLGKAAGEDLIGQLATVFLTDSESRVAVLHEALGDDDRATVAETAHAMLGASANLGATELARLCEALEAKGAAGDLAGAGVLMTAIEVELGRVRSALGASSPTP